MKKEEIALQLVLKVIDKMDKIPTNADEIDQVQSVVSIYNLILSKLQLEK